MWWLTQALEQRQTLDAVRCLREQLVQLVPPGDPQHLHRLSTCLLADTVSEMYQLAGLPPGTSADSGRQNLITSLQVPLSPSPALPCRKALVSHLTVLRLRMHLRQTAREGPYCSPAVIVLIQHTDSKRLY